MKKILIIDDQAENVFYLQDRLQKEGFEVISANSGRTGIEAALTQSPDLILLDIMMPQMDGFETIKRIRKDNRFSKLPVIALTAYAMLDNKNVIEKNGFNDLVTKPINFQTLSAKITKYLSEAPRIL